MDEEAMDHCIDKHQDRMCELCELYILGCAHNTQHFQCEGSRCDSGRSTWCKIGLGLFEKLTNE